MRRIPVGVLIGWGIVLLVMFATGKASAQEPVLPYFGVTAPNGTRGYQPVDAAHPLPVTIPASGGTPDVNIAEVNGAPPSASNGLFIQPGTAPGDAPTNLMGSATMVWDPVGQNWQRARGGPGVVGTGTLRVVQATDSPAVPLAGSMTTAGCTVGVASAQCVPAATAQRWIQLQNTSTANQIACSWGGTASINSATSFMLAPGQSASWGPNSGGVPTNALNCIASGAGTPLYVELRG